jgi:hypothetical protein
MSDPNPYEYSRLFDVTCSRPSGTSQPVEGARLIATRAMRWMSLEEDVVLSTHTPIVNGWCFVAGISARTCGRAMMPTGDYFDTFGTFGLSPPTA